MRERTEGGFNASDAQRRELAQLRDEIKAK
jgi:hypothetical protein